MEPLWITVLGIVISALIASAVSMMAACMRFYAKKRGRIALDVLFLLPLAIPSVIAYMVPVIVCSVFQLFPPAANPAIAGLDMLWALPLTYLFAILGFRNVSTQTVEVARLHGLRCCGLFYHVFFVPAFPWLLGGFAILLLRGLALVLFSESMIHSS